ncbi:unnamed protein product, partial [Coregonus sp. 'balchen']
MVVSVEELGYPAGLRGPWLGQRGEDAGLFPGFPTEVLSNLHGFQDLFQYLRTSTLLLQLSDAAAL